MTSSLHPLKLCLVLLAYLLLNGCATATSSLECGIETLHPTVMSAVDSFESSALAIRLSNMVLLEMPISEQDHWPDKLYGAPSGAGMFKMGLSLLGASQGIAMPFEIDPKTGLPRPTSALYIFLKEREQLLTKSVHREDLLFFRSQPLRVIARELPVHRRDARLVLIDEYVYRNPLMAFGVVTTNREEMIRVQQDLDLLAQGFKQCDAWVHTSREGDIKPAACRDPALQKDSLQSRMTRASFTPAQPAAPQQPSSDEGPALTPARNLHDAFVDSGRGTDARPLSPVRRQDRTTQLQSRLDKRDRGARTLTLPEATATKHSNTPPEFPATVESPPDQERGVIYANESDRQAAEKEAELEVMRKNYGKLAGRVYNATVAGADFTTAALVKIGCAIANGTKALSNIQNEFKGARGAYNLALVASRIRMIVNAFGYYQQNLGIQFTAYTTMYQQIKGIYPELKDENPARAEKTAQALQRIQLTTNLLRNLQPKFDKLSRGYDVDFTDDDLAQLTAMAELYPNQQELQQELLLAWQE